MEKVETGNSKEKYLEVKKNTRKAAYQDKICKRYAEQGKDLEALCGGMIRNVMFKIAKRMVKTNQDSIVEHHFKNDDDVLAVINEDKKIAGKSYHEKLLNTEFCMG